MPPDASEGREWAERGAPLGNARLEGRRLMAAAGALGFEAIEGSRGHPGRPHMAPREEKERFTAFSGV